MHSRKRNLCSPNTIEIYFKTSILLSLLIAQLLPFISIPIAAATDNFSKACREYCDSNRPAENNNGAYNLSCATTINPDNCDVDKLCEKFNCSQDICKKGMIECPSKQVAKPRDVGEGSSDGGFFSAIPVWFVVIFVIALIITCICIICGFARHGLGGGGFGGGYGGPGVMGGYGDPYYNGVGCGGGGGYHHHHHPAQIGCGGGGGYYSHYSMGHHHHSGMFESHHGW